MTTIRRTYRSGRRFVKPSYNPPVPILVSLLFLLAASGPALAQGLPPLSPISPGRHLAQRALVRALPRSAARDDGTQISASTTPARSNTTTSTDAAYLLDSELLRLEATATRDIGSNAFLLLDAQLGGAYDGFMDGFLDWYHDLLGIAVPERERRPHNAFLYGTRLADGTLVNRDPSDIFLGDTRVGVGLRLDAAGFRASPR